MSKRLDFEKMFYDEQREKHKLMMELDSLEYIHYQDIGAYSADLQHANEIIFEKDQRIVELEKELEKLKTGKNE
jgi:hypothetical protein